MESSNLNKKNLDINLKVALVVSFGMFVVCLTYCLASLQFRGAVEAQRIHPTPTPELYKNALDMVHFSYWVAMPALGFCYLVIAGWIWKYRRERKKIELHEKDAT
jgi:hypothetical protein